MANYNGPLYDRACSVFQRRVKQVYFQLNPFLERTNLKDDEAESYQPSSKFVIPLKSIVVCEQFDSDNAQDWKALNPGEFWEYLYSDSWGDDCSLRVLEGELLELLKMLLCVMEKNGEITCHNTFAYATNQRKVTKCFVNSMEKKEEYVKETLLIEFIYYGVSEKKKCDIKKKDALVSWKDYKEMASKAAGLTKLADIVDLMESSKKKKKEGDFMSLIRPPKSTSMSMDSNNDVRMEVLTAIKWQEGLKSKRRNLAKLTHHSKNDDARGSLDHMSPGSDNGSELLARMDEILFDKSKKIGRTRRATTFFRGSIGRRVAPGDEFYINKLKPNHQEPFKACDFLRAQREAKIAEREKEIEEVKQLSERMEQSKLEYSLGENIQVSDESYNGPLLKVYDRKASFGEFYKYLEEENRYDPRFKKGFQKRRKPEPIKGQSKIAIGIKKSVRVKLSSVISISGKASSSGVAEETKKLRGPKIVQDRQRFANEVGGVTDSEAAKKHCLVNVTSDHKSPDSIPVIRPPQQTSRMRRHNSLFSDNPSSNKDSAYYPVLPKITSPIMERESRSESYGDKQTPTNPTTTPQSRGGNKSTVSRKTATTVDSDSDEMESPYSEVDDEEDDFQDTVFDTKKLNRKYSIEKIRAIKSKKEKKPPVLNILKKFCRVNRIMALAAKPSKEPGRKSFTEPRKSVAEANKAKQTAKTFGMFRRLNKKKDPADTKTKIEVGKLKEFQFLKHKDYKFKIPDISVPSFQTCSADDFRLNLLKALDSFVIRKEMITSSYTFETVTTVTFTRPAAYVRIHQMPKD